MNIFPRHARYEGHLIQGLPNWYKCAECHGQLAWVCGDRTESADCFKYPEHTGLIANREIQIPIPDSSIQLRELINVDPAVASMVKVVSACNIKLLFGD